MRTSLTCLAVFGVTATLLIGCATEEGTDAGVTWHQDVWPIIEGRCVNCHTSGGIAPFDLTSYAGAKPVAELIRKVTEDRTMPPWHAGGEQVYVGNPSLTDAQIATIAAWADGGAKEGDASKPGEPLTAVGLTMSRTDVALKVPEPYTPQYQTGDDYRCFLVDWPETEERFVTGFAVEPDNKGEVHHVAAFLLAPDAIGAAGAMSSLAELDAKEAGPGYACYGGPSGAADLVVPIQQVGQWVPGQDGMDFPAGTGIRVPPGSKVVIQMHYNTDFVTPGPDQTQVKFKLDKPADISKPGAFAPWLKVAWLGDAMKIPAGEKSVTHEQSGDPRSFWKNFIGDVKVEEGFWIYGALLHMHTLGVTAETFITRKDGTKVTIVRTPAYDFDWQRMYLLAEPIRFEQGDTLSVRCTWDNSPENQIVTKDGRAAPADVFWGEGSLEEMCVANLYISEL